MSLLEFVEMFQRQIYSYCGCQVVSKGQWSYIGVYAGNRELPICWYTPTAAFTKEGYAR